MAAGIATCIDKASPQQELLAAQVRKYDDVDVQGGWGVGTGNSLEVTLPSHLLTSFLSLSYIFFPFWLFCGLNRRIWEERRLEKKQSTLPLEQGWGG